MLRYGRYVGLHGKRLGRAERFFGRYGGIVVLVARFIEETRQLNGILAGAAIAVFACVLLKRRKHAAG
ncbi:MAG: hypothetical protein ACPMAQ_14040 [Phycisphaerae bacterium]